jgi:intein/homing endonuclease
MSMAYSTRVVVAVDGKKRVVQIGELVDRLVSVDRLADRHAGPNHVVAQVAGLECVGVSPTERVAWTGVTHVSRHPANGDMVTVTTKHGRTVRATASHSFLVRAGGRVVARPGSDLVVGDSLPVAKDLPAHAGSGDLDDLAAEFRRTTREEPIPGTREVAHQSADDLTRGQLTRLGRDDQPAIHQAVSADVWWDPIVNIQVDRNSQETVYDFTVDERLQSFMLSNGVFVHNTLNT